MYEIWLSEPWDAQPRWLKGCLRPLSHEKICLFTTEAGVCLLVSTRYEGDSISAVYRDIPVTVNLDLLTRPYEEIWAEVEQVSQSPAEAAAALTRLSALQPFGIGTLALANGGWTGLAFTEAYRNALETGEAPLFAAPPERQAEETVQLVYHTSTLTVVVKMARADLRVEFYFVPSGLFSAGSLRYWRRVAELLTVEERAVWEEMRQRALRSVVEASGQSLEVLLRRRSPSEVRLYFRALAEADASFLRTHMVELTQRFGRQGR